MPCSLPSSCLCTHCYFCLVHPSCPLCLLTHPSDCSWRKGHYPQEAFLNPPPIGLVRCPSLWFPLYWQLAYDYCFVSLLPQVDHELLEDRSCSLSIFVSPTHSTLPGVKCVCSEISIFIQLVIVIMGIYELISTILLCVFFLLYFFSSLSSPPPFFAFYQIDCILFFFRGFIFYFRSFSGNS